MTLLAETLGLSPDDRAQLLGVTRPETHAPDHLPADTFFSAPAQPEIAASAEEAAQAPQPRAPMPLRIGALPTAPNRFVGRVREVEEIYTLLRDPDVRLLTLTGPGGIGKTRLTLRVPAEL